MGIAALILTVTPPATREPSRYRSEEIPAQIRQQILRAYGELPLYFVENRGQMDPRILYYVQGRDKSIYFTPQGITFALMGSRDREAAPKAKQDTRVRNISHRRTGRQRLEPAEKRWVVKLDFLGANP